ncbi:hypothetical protein C347_00731 [Cryptococcus neoformans AD2-60a]|nr:hypothetical protein C347_00731 [Cryptococcus neoformans var. grubii AD2-60a]OXG45585.1 hypothetical protein C359_00271 [Cryptococcus neoformans var. grubii Bt120]
MLHTTNRIFARGGDNTLYFPAKLYMILIRNVTQKGLPYSCTVPGHDIEYKLFILGRPQKGYWPFVRCARIHHVHCYCRAGQRTVDMIGGMHSEGKTASAS